MLLVRYIYRQTLDNHKYKMDSSVPTSSSMNEFSGIASEVIHAYLLESNKRLVWKRSQWNLYQKIRPMKGAEINF